MARKAKRSFKRSNFPIENPTYFSRRFFKFPPSPLVRLLLLLEFVLCGLAVLGAGILGLLKFTRQLQ